jgi:Tfp pilus assembly protein PilZ
MAERRKYNRIRKQLKVRFGERELELEGTTADLSVSGLFVHAHPLPPVGTRLHLQLFGEQGRFVYLEGRVRRHRTEVQERAGFGVRTLDAAELLHELVPRPAAPRAATRFRLEVETQEQLERLFYEQVRRGGVFVETEAELERHALAEIELALLCHSPTKVMTFKAEVIHSIAAGSRPNEPAGIGFEFYDPEAVLTALQPLVRADLP